MTIQKKIFGIQIGLCVLAGVQILFASYVMVNMKPLSKQTQEPVRKLIYGKINTLSTNSNNKSSLSDSAACC
jgi:hypothetical protein